MVSLVKNTPGVGSFLEVDWLHFTEVFLFWASIHVQAMAFRQAVLSVENGDTLPVRVLYPLAWTFCRSYDVTQQSLDRYSSFKRLPTLSGEHSELCTNDKSFGFVICNYLWDSTGPLSRRYKVLATYTAIWRSTQSTYSRALTWLFARRAILPNLDISLVDDIRLLPHTKVHVEMGRWGLHWQQKMETFHVATYACIRSEWNCNGKSSPSRSDCFVETPTSSLCIHWINCYILWFICCSKSEWLGQDKYQQRTASFCN